MKLFWMVLAGIGVVAAAFFLWRGELDKAFVLAALGMVAWLLNYRAQLKEITRAADEDDENNGDELENGEDDN